MLNRRLFVVLIGAAWLAGGLTTTSHAQDFFGDDNWNAQYFDNPTLSGSPILTRNETRLDLRFGDQSPSPEVPNDRFSAIFTTTETFQADTTYEFVANVDDGVRVIVGGITVIDQFNSPPGTYTGQLRIQGQQEIRVEYREDSGNAAIEFFWRIAPPPPPPPVPPGAVTGTVIRATSLVVREAPYLSAPRIRSIRRGETYVVIGRDPDARWFLLDLGDVQGWAWGYYLFIDGNEFTPPVAGPFTLAGVSETGVVVQAVAGLKLRAEPNVTSAQIGRITWGALLPVTGRSERGSWYQVVWLDTQGWVFAPYTEPVEGDIESVPFVPGSGALIQIGPAADPDYDITAPDAPTPTPIGPTPIPVEGGEGQ